MTALRNIFLCTVALLIGACSLFPTDNSEIEKGSAELLYKEGKASLKAGDFKTAINKFESLEARYPFGHYSQQALLEIAYAYYKFGEADSAISTANRFIKLYPRHKHVDYAYYLRGLASYNLSKNFFDRMFDVDPAQRDPKRARQSFQYFSELVQRYPNSKYVRDAVQRMVYLKNRLASYEVDVARYYFKRGAYLAAVNRAKYVIDNYEKTPAVPDALGVMVKAYRKMDMNELANGAEKILELNYPDHPHVANNRQPPKDQGDTGNVQ
ncbi:MAG TPA: outer membrane protein assembly factor BamD [Gammaproteobacteria bacterium]|nr:outer membrane protein assembly factor BamD [Gammaproteobacteria bacterium]